MTVATAWTADHPLCKKLGHKWPKHGATRTARLRVCQRCDRLGLAKL